MWGPHQEEFDLGKKMNKIGLFDYLMLLIYAFIMGCAQILMAKAAEQVGSNTQVKGILQSVLQSEWLWISIVFYVIATAFWLFILFRVDIRIAYPIAMTSVVFAGFIKCVLENEFPNPLYWFGLLIIMIGLYLINISRV